MEITSHDDKAPILRALPSRLLGQTAALVSKVAAEALQSVGSHRHQFAVLATLEAFGTCSQADLCRRTDLDRSDMNSVVTVLEDRGQITRSVDERNRRQNVVSLTAAGRTAFRSQRSVLDKAQSLALSPLSADERDELLRLLGRVHDHLTSAGSQRA